MDADNDIYSLIRPSQVQGVDCSHSALSSCNSFSDGFLSFLNDQFHDDEVASAEPTTIQGLASGLGSDKSGRPPKPDSPAGARPGAVARTNRRKLHNRASQRQWRTRQKTRADNLEAQIEAKTAQLKALHASQQQLEAQNAMLEDAVPQAIDVDTQHIYTLGNVDLTDLQRSDTQQTLTITVLGGLPQLKTRQDVRHMSFAEFAMLTAAYARKLASCFIELTKTDSPSGAPAQITRTATNSPALVCGAVANSPTKAALHNPALENLRMWTRECSSLRAFLAISDIKKYLDFISHRLDGRPGFRTCDLDDKQNHDMLAAMQFTEAQQQDVLLLRRLFYGKLGVLARQRRDCLRRMPHAAAATEYEVSNRLSEVVDVAQELVDITAAERQTRLQFTSAYRRGVYTLTQQAMSMVTAFPYVTENPYIFDMLAAERGAQV
ncbi:hypothetical protein WJX77_008373 [Trebouxia sp. C0004]